METKTVFKAIGETSWKQVYKMYKTKSKSRKWEWFEENGITLERLKNPVRWNIKELFDKKL